MDNTLVKILVEDCGGHGRALEILWDLLEGQKRNNSFDIDSCNIDGLLYELRMQLTNLYRAALPKRNNEIVAIVRAVFLNQHLPPNQKVPGTNKRPEKFAAPGLISYDTEKERLHMPYIWLWLMAERTADAIPGWRLNDYPDMVSKEDKPLQYNVSWENFEIFIARFRHLKSLLMKEGKATSIAEFHKGARLQGNIKFTNHHLNPPVRAFEQITTKSTGDNKEEWLIKTNEGLVDLRKHKHVVLNKSGASAGDSFLSLDTKSARRATEVHQAKLFTISEVTIKVYFLEREKSASPQDFFLVFTTQKKVPDFELPDNSGIVDISNWDNYFGTVAGRAYFYYDNTPININTSSITKLQMINGITYDTAITIDQHRKKKPFSSVEDVQTRLGGWKLSKKVLGQFAY